MNIFVYIGIAVAGFIGICLSVWYFLIYRKKSKSSSKKSFGNPGKIFITTVQLDANEYALSDEKQYDWKDKSMISIITEVLKTIEINKETKALDFEPVLYDGINKMRDISDFQDADGYQFTFKYRIIDKSKKEDKNYILLLDDGKVTHFSLVNDGDVDAYFSKLPNQKKLKDYVKKPEEKIQGVSVTTYSKQKLS